jgi:hypothetical protein
MRFIRAEADVKAIGRGDVSGIRLQVLSASDSDRAVEATTTTTSAGSPATTSTKWCSTRRPRLPHRKPHPQRLQVTDPTDNTTGAVS